jgi:hypothetical protein
MNKEIIRSAGLRPGALQKSDFSRRVGDRRSNSVPTNGGRP